METVGGGGWRRGGGEYALLRVRGKAALEAGTSLTVIAESALFHFTHPLEGGI